MYFKGIAQHAPHYSSLAEAHALVISIQKRDPNPELFHANVLCEYLPLTKIVSISPEATAFRRDPTPSILIVIAWKVGVSQDESLNTEKARQWANELANIVNKGQGGAVTATQSLGYGNYGGWSICCR